jgi:hypothetical protein
VRAHNQVVHPSERTNAGYGTGYWTISVAWTIKPFSSRGPDYTTTKETPTIAFGWAWPAKRHYLRQAYNRILSL